MNRAVFLDRDGTINEEVGYINHIDRFKVFPWAASAIRRLNDAGARSIVVTNQSGVARGYFPESLVHEVHSKLRTELAEGGGMLDAIYYCPHHPEAKIPSLRQRCECRKPQAGMLKQAAHEFALDLDSCYVVGDRYLDMELAHRIGSRSVLVLSGYGRGEYLFGKDTWTRQPDHVAENLSDAIDWILSTFVP